MEPPEQGVSVMWMNIFVILHIWQYACVIHFFVTEVYIKNVRPTFERLLIPFVQKCTMYLHTTVVVNKLLKLKVNEVN